MSDACTRCHLFHPVGASCLGLSLPEAAAPDQLPAGTVLAGRYSIIRTIQRGGMSVIYLAEDTLRLREWVVLKEQRPNPGATQAERQEIEAWFARESYLLSSLRSPLIPRFHSVFMENGLTYIVQEYVEGNNLDQVVLTHGPLDESLVIGWGVALCTLLSYLHEQDEPVVYRDLKPANIIVRTGALNAPTGDCPLAVVDFGIARPFRQGVVGTVIGTPGYAPPEQYQGLATPQSDVYALGATLHRLLTGYDPEHGVPFTFPPIRKLNPQVSPELADVVERALRLDPAARYASAGVMGAALRELAGAKSFWPDLPAVRGRGVGLPIPTRGSWIALVVGALLFGPLMVSGIGALMNRPATGSVTFEPATVWVLPDQPPGQDDGSGLPGPSGDGMQFQTPDQNGGSGDEIVVGGQAFPLSALGTQLHGTWSRNGRFWGTHHSDFGFGGHSH